MCYAARQTASAQESNSILSLTFHPIPTHGRSHSRSLNPNCRGGGVGRGKAAGRMRVSVHASAHAPEHARFPLREQCRIVRPGRGEAEAAKIARNPRELAFWRHGAESCYRFLCVPSPGPYCSTVQVHLSHPEPWWARGS